jgi:hypothetical protein
MLNTHGILENKYSYHNILHVLIASSSFLATSSTKTVNKYILAKFDARKQLS